MVMDIMDHISTSTSKSRNLDSDQPQVIEAAAAHIECWNPDELLGSVHLWLGLWVPTVRGSVATGNRGSRQCVPCRIRWVSLLTPVVRLAQRDAVCTKDAGTNRVRQQSPVIFGSYKRSISSFSHDLTVEFPMDFP